MLHEIRARPVGIAALAAIRAHWFCARPKRFERKHVAKNPFALTARSASRATFLQFPHFPSTKQRRVSDWALEFGI
jgi:hypothetical protein